MLQLQLAVFVVGAEMASEREKQRIEEAKEKPVVVAQQEPKREQKEPVPQKSNCGKRKREHWTHDSKADRKLARESGRFELPVLTAHQSVVVARANDVLEQTQQIDFDKCPDARCRYCWTTRQRWTLLNMFVRSRFPSKMALRA